MKLWEQTLSVFFLLLCGRSLTVSSLRPEELYRIKSYVHGPFTYRGEYAYVAKFTRNECNNLTEDVIRRALGDDMAEIDKTKLNRRVYVGTRMVLATVGKDLHAEYRLLFPENSSPVEKLLSKMPAAGCAMFYTYLSPCLERCTLPTSPYYIVDRLHQLFARLNNKAFVYSLIYFMDKHRLDEVMHRLKSINSSILVFRCDRSCIQCFTKRVFNEECVKLNNNRDRSLSPSYWDDM